MSSGARGPRDTPEVSRVGRAHHRHDSLELYQDASGAGSSSGGGGSAATRHRSRSTHQQAAFEQKFHFGVLTLQAQPLSPSPRQRRAGDASPRAAAAAASADRDGGDGEMTEEEAEAIFFGDVEETKRVSSLSQRKGRKSLTISATRESFDSYRGSPASGALRSPRRSPRESPASPKGRTASSSAAQAFLAQLDAVAVAPVEAQPGRALPRMPAATVPEPLSIAADPATFALRMLRSAGMPVSPVPAQPSPPPAAGSALSSFTVYHEGALKIKGFAPSSGPVVAQRGQPGRKTYVVWHSRGLSLYASQKEYTSDTRPSESIANPWMRKGGQEDTRELFVVPYSSNSASPNAGSAQLLKQSLADSQLLRVVIAPYSALDRINLLPRDSTLFILKANSAQEAGGWIAASSRVHALLARSRRTHQILPLLHQFLENPAGFLQSHGVDTRERERKPSLARPSTVLGPLHHVVEEADDGGDDDDRADTPPRPAHAEVEKSLSESMRILQGTPSPLPDLSLPPPAAFTPEPLSGGFEIAVTPAARTASNSVPDESHSNSSLASSPSDGWSRSASASVDNTFLGPTGLGMGFMASLGSSSSASVTSASSSPRLPAQPGSPLSSSSPAPLPPPHRKSRTAAMGSMSLSAESRQKSLLTLPSPRARAVSVTMGPSAAESDVSATNVLQYYGFNGETPLFPPLPLVAVERYALSPPSVPLRSMGRNPSSSSSLVVTLDMMGPRRTDVYQLLQWILMQFPGSSFEFPEVEPAAPSAAGAGASSPQSTVVPPSAPPSAWSAPHVLHAFLLFRGAYLDPTQLLEWVEAFWESSSDPGLFGPHEAHHLRANILFLLGQWVEHFRRDYLGIKELVDAFLRDAVYSSVIVQFQAVRASEEACGDCAAWTRQAHREGKQPVCMDLFALAAHISNTVALTAGTSKRALSEFVSAHEAALAAAGPIFLLAPTMEENDGDGDELSDLPQPQRARARTITSPLERRQSFAALRISTDRSPGSRKPSLSVHEQPPSPLTATTPKNFGSQAHRPPHAFAHRLSNLKFLQKFVGFSSSAASQKLLSFTPKAIAAELTNLDLESLQCIHLRELAQKAWTERDPVQRAAKAGSVIQFIESFNRRSFWVASEILKAESNGAPTSPNDSSASLERTLSARVATLQFFIQVLAELASLHNYYAMFSILNGLSLNPLFRLQKLWKALPVRDASVLHSFRHGLLDPVGNYKAYRETLRSVHAKNLAHIAHFAILLKDVFQLEELPTFLTAKAVDKDAAPPTPMLNWNKFAKEYVELHNALLLSQASLPLYARAQVVTDSSEITSPVSAAPFGASPSLSRSRSASTTALSPPRLVRSSTLASLSPAAVTRPALPPSEPGLRMCLHLSFQRVMSEDKLYSFSYRCEPKKKDKK